MWLQLVIHVVAFLVASVAVGRAARLVVHDHYPPMKALRSWWLNQTVMKGGWREDWAPLLVGKDGGSGCPFCFAPYAAAVDLLWYLLSDAGTVHPEGWGWWWWVVNVWAAVSYVAAIVVLRDEPPAED